MIVKHLSVYIKCLNCSASTHVAGSLACPARQFRQKVMEITIQRKVQIEIAKSMFLPMSINLQTNLLSINSTTSSTIGSSNKQACSLVDEYPICSLRILSVRGSVNNTDYLPPYTIFLPSIHTLISQNLQEGKMGRSGTYDCETNLSDRN